eukprot:TRINITY_DN7466_c0_g1_i1.p1 TRINITY_DN7466_c0_g1~~TRINITY_DN7466_c0_g1_i1.p1  ORF type:complete len:103 (-),score=15.48 TRINITY_DN7466_c0_g1_i1:259-567(-)
MTNHTIILLQTTPSRQTRTFNDFETVAQAMDGVCQLFEQKIKSENSMRGGQISYDIKDLWKFIDSLTDISALVYNPALRAYEPKAKDWIKDTVFKHLKKIAV